MSHFSKFCTSPGRVVLSDLPTQFDRDVAGVADRQCSWFAVGIAARARAIAALTAKSDFDSLRTLYIDTLWEATRHKASSTSRADIETLFHPAILAAHPETGLEFAAVRWNPDIEDTIDTFLDMFPNGPAVKATKASLPHVPVSKFRADVDSLHASHRALVVNRSSMSFAVIPVAMSPESGGDGSGVPPTPLFLVLDSHVRECGAMTADQLVLYAFQGLQADVGLLLTYGITATFE